MDPLQTMLSCLPCTPASPASDPAPSDTADEFVATLLSAEKPGKELDQKLDKVVGTAGWNWKETLGKAILARLERAIAIGAQMAPAMKEALDKAVAAATDFAKEHPVYTTLIAVGVLVVLSPWVVEALGFGELGPIEGTFAAAWERSFAGYVPRGALFTYFQRLGMVWRRHLKP